VRSAADLVHPRVARLGRHLGELLAANLQRCTARATASRLARTSGQSCLTLAPRTDLTGLCTQPQQPGGPTTMTLVASGLTSGFVSSAGWASVGACTSASLRVLSGRTASSSWRFLGGRTLHMSQMLQQSRTIRLDRRSSLGVMHELQGVGPGPVQAGVPDKRGVYTYPNRRCAPRLRTVSVSAATGPCPLSLPREARPARWRPASDSDGWEAGFRP
jgi:hypothetical protein